MRNIIQEYGLFAIAAVGIIAFFIVLRTFLVGDTSVVANQALAAVDMGTDGGTIAPTEDSWGITNVTTDSSKTSFPYFEIADSKKYVIMPDNVGTEDILGSEETYIERDFLLDGVHAYYDVNGIKTEIPQSSIVINLIIYEPKMELAVNTEDDASKQSIAITGQMVTEQVRAVDKFGNFILDDDGNYVLTTRAAYLRNSRDRGIPSEELAATDYQDYGTYIIDFGGLSSGTYTADEIKESDYQGLTEWALSSDLPYKVKVIYRVKNGTLNSEYTAIFTNQMRNQRPRAEKLYEDFFTEGVRNYSELNKEPVAVMNLLPEVEDYSWEGYTPELPDEEEEEEEEPTPSPTPSPEGDSEEELEDNVDEDLEDNADVDNSEEVSTPSTTPEPSTDDESSNNSSDNTTSEESSIETGDTSTNESTPNT